jgi:glutaminase-like protein
LIASSFHASGGEVLLIDDPRTREVVDILPFEIAELRANLVRAVKAELTEAEADDAAALAAGSGIPFDYLEDCCCSRAHAMWRLFRSDFEMRKIWNFGDHGLGIHSPRNTLYGGLWCFHVAPLVKVRLSNGSVIEKVIDPALFGRAAISVAEWIKIQKDSSAVHETTGPEIFYQESGGTNAERDDDFSTADAYLAEHREYVSLL